MMVVMVMVVVMVMAGGSVASCQNHFDQSGNVYISEADAVVEKVSTTAGAGESWGRAGTGTQIGGSQESNMPLVNAIQPFGTPKASLVLS